MPAPVHVELGPRSYEIHIAPGVLDGLGERCTERKLGSRCMVVSDTNVAPLYLDRCMNSLAAAGIQASSVVIPAGEPSKQHGPLIDLYGHALEQGLDRKAFVVALGGGVVGDLAGFAAASYLRGIGLVQVPTSLLAMVDSAVGGKTGINLPQGKNLVGAFHQPAFVAVDPAVLKTLPARELSAGLAEVIKYGVIFDAELFALLERELDAIRALDDARIAHIVQRSCEIKAEVVRQDEREGGLRAILNYGHTLGHAVEQVTGYTRYLHGEAIGIGMAYAADLSAKVHGLPAEDVERQRALCERAGLPVHDDTLEWSALADAMRVDKKSVDAVPRFVLADRIGHVDFGVDVQPEVLEEVWRGRGQ